MINRSRPNDLARLRRRVRLAGGVILMAVVIGLAAGQTRPRPPRRSVTQSPAARLPDAVTISYPDSVNLAAFVDYVSQTLDVKIVYGDEVRNQSVVFRPGEVDVPKDQLLDLLRSMLRMSDLALVEGDVEGWLRIVQTSDLQRHARKIRRPDELDGVGRSNRVVTQVVRITSADMATVVKHARGFLSSPKASVIEIPDKHLLVITDYESALLKALEIIRLLDDPGERAEIETVRVDHQEAAALAGKVTKLLADKAKMESAGHSGVMIYAEPEARSIVLVGLADAIDEARELIDRFDTPVDASENTIAYAPVHMSADRLQRLITGIVAPDGVKNGTVGLFLDERVNRLYVTAPPTCHEQITAMVAREDVAGTESTRPLRIYRPENRAAQDLMGTLSQVLPNVLATATSGPAIASLRSDSAEKPPGPNRSPATPGPGRTPPMPPAQVPIEGATNDGAARITRVEGQDFVLSYDEHTNAIIAIGPREFHVRLTELLYELDKRQPQVLIEMTLVAITMNDSLSLATELANEEENLGHRSLFFSSFGISGVDLATGARAFNPGGGLNGIIAGPYETPFLIRAIAAHGNSHIMATPKTIVADNTTSTISSVEESPFTSINASDTVATTSFAGFESAGTTLTVTPRIAQGDHLTLDYTLNFSNFTGSGAAGVPPPRTTNSFSATVEIPDAHTIIVGGLVTENEADSVSEIPLLGRIPGVGVLFQSSERARTKTRVYAFIRATILRDDRFADLKLISRSELERASLENRDYPGDTSLWMH